MPPCPVSGHGVTFLLSSCLRSNKFPFVFFIELLGQLAQISIYNTDGIFHVNLRNQIILYNNKRIKAKLKGLPPAIYRQQALSAA